MSETYEATYICGNCRFRFTRTLQKGTPAQRKGGECPNCGCKDGQEGIGVFQVGDPIKKEQVLMERYHSTPRP
jgi:DNA-directed RNA polymerase subunit RPC12/RpoP